MSRPVIGILASRIGSRFIEPIYLRSLVREGERLGAYVYLFSNEDVNERGRRVRGFRPDGAGGWRQKPEPWPDVVIDRRRSRWTPAFRSMRRKPLFPYANSKFTVKWHATRMFAENETVKRWIPQTSLYTPEALEKMLASFPIVYVKPTNGTGGGSVVRIGRYEGAFRIKGRQRNGRLVQTVCRSTREVASWLQRWQRTQPFRRGKFMLQQGLDLSLIPERNVDSRLLIQKNGYGEWETTGMAVRISGRNSPTTNLLYGDGKAYPFDSFMMEHFGEEKAKAIREDCEKLAHRLMRVIEARYGPMMEFGLDVGVDVEGKVWLIEANPKPSRDVFLKSGEREKYLTAIQRPIQYAIYLANKERAAGSAGQKSGREP